MDVEIKIILYFEEIFFLKNNLVRKDIVLCLVLFSFGFIIELIREKK